MFSYYILYACLFQQKFKGDITLDNTRFTYPARPDIEILQGLSIKALAGETLALVGTSGCGKSTTIQLIERFYDPAKGQIVSTMYLLMKLSIFNLPDHEVSF